VKQTYTDPILPIFLADQENHLEKKRSDTEGHVHRYDAETEQPIGKKENHLDPPAGLINTYGGSKEPTAY
jgi:hypothetical protein